MSSFGNQFSLSPQLSPITPPGMHSSLVKTERRDEHGSRSSSADEGCYGRGDQPKNEGEEDTSLTSQTLNADGTPKRPMNAFMIFARRRRPQVSAENQSMRTGEISKILSKEWVSMPASEKQFYLEQAKLLKETFNTKYPDYVYRRRPNNSRKRRRSDSGASRSVDQALFGDNPDDYGPGYDLDASPTDVEEFQDPSLSPYARHPHEASPPTIPNKFANQPHRGSISQPYPSPEVPFRSSNTESHRLSFSGPTPNDRLGHSIDASPRISMNALHYSYNQTGSGHQTVSSLIGTDTSQQNWQPRNSWGSERQSTTHQKLSSYSPPTPWATPVESPSNTTPSSNPPGFFPTLNAAFYPNQSNMPPYPSNGSPNSPQSLPTSASHFDDPNSLESGPPREFGSRIYSNPVSPVAPSPSPSYNLPREPASYSQRLPPMQTVSYNQPQSLTPPSTSHPHPQSTYWRD